MKRRLLAGLLISTACVSGPTYPVVAPETEKELFILSETARFASALRVDVQGEITSRAYLVSAGTAGCPAGGAGCVAAGWYIDGVAYYHRPFVNRSDSRTLTSLAAHEVCHARVEQHGPEHEECIRALDRPSESLYYLN